MQPAAKTVSSVSETDVTELIFCGKEDKNGKTSEVYLSAISRGNSRPVRYAAVMTAIKTDMVTIFETVFFFFFVRILILSFQEQEKTSKGLHRQQADEQDIL